MENSQKAMNSQSSFEQEEPARAIILSDFKVVQYKKNTGKKLLDVGLGNGFLHMTQKQRIQKQIYIYIYIYRHLYIDVCI